MHNPPYVHLCGEAVPTIALAFVHLQTCPRETARAERIGTRHRARVPERVELASSVRRSS